MLTLLDLNSPLEIECRIVQDSSTKQKVDCNKGGKYEIFAGWISSFSFTTLLSINGDLL